MRTIFPLVKCWLSIGLICAASIAQAEMTPDVFSAVLTAKYPGAVGSKIAPAFPGFWSVIKNGEVLYFNDELSIMISGDVVDLKANQSISAKLRSENEPKIDTAQLNLKDAIKLGSGSRVLYVFSDPDCPYCRQLEPVLRQLQDATVYIFPMPLVQLHPNAKIVAESIWCQINREHAWKSYMDMGIAPKASKCANPIDRNLALAQSLNIQGTPAIIFADGSIIPGAVPLERLNAKLNTVGTNK